MVGNCLYIRRRLLNFRIKSRLLLMIFQPEGQLKNCLQKCYGQRYLILCHVARFFSVAC